MQFSKYVHHVVINDEMVILDEPGDKYWLLSHSDTQAVIHAVQSRLDTYPPELQELVQCKILTLERGTTHINIGSPRKLGLNNHEWSQSFKANLTKVSAFSIIKASLALTLSFITTKTFGLHKTLNLIRKIKRNRLSTCKLELKELQQISSSIKQASKILPFSTSCLQHSICTFLLCAIKGEVVTLKIGVKTYDFFAHAWTESDSGLVIGDKQEIPESLHEILSI
ncbi:lasso peptide biosynthesis B2 protein [Pseudomonas sp. 57B-090624]|nr:lasso peptide biosynthesis B2 protein [Pseudomonas sp. 57B-090624]